MADTPNSDDSPVRIQEAESTQDSSETEQESYSPDSTVRDGELHTQRSTSNRPMLNPNDNRIIGEGVDHQGLIARNSASSENLNNQSEHCSASQPTYSTNEIDIMRQNLPKLFDCLTRQTTDNLINQTKEITASGQMSESSTSARLAGSPKRTSDSREQATASGFQAQPSTLNVNASSSLEPVKLVQQNPLLTDMLSESSAPQNNLINQGEEITASGFRAQLRTSNLSATNSPEPAPLVHQNPLLTNMLAETSTANNVINQREQITASRLQAQPSTSNESASNSPEPFPLVQQIALLANLLVESFAANILKKQREQTTASELQAQPSTSNASTSSSLEPVSLVQQNPLLANMFEDNSAANESLINQEQKCSSEMRTKHPAQPGQVIKEEETSACKLTLQRCPTSKNEFSSPQPLEQIKQNPILPKMLTINPEANENLINKRRQSNISTSTLQSRVPTPRASCPTKPRQVVKQGKLSSVSGQTAQHKISTASASSPKQSVGRVQQNPLLTDMLACNPAVQRNMINQGQQSASGSGAEPRTSAVVKPKQSSSGQLAQSRTSTASASSSIQRGIIVRQNPLLTNMLWANPTAKGNLSRKGEQSSTSRSIAQSSSTVKASYSSQPRQEVKQQKQISASGQMAKHSISTPSVSSQKQSVEKRNPLLTNMLAVDPTVSRSLINRRQQSFASGLGAQSSTSAVVKQEQSSSEQMAQRRTSTASVSVSTPKKCSETVKQTSLLTNMLTVNPTAEKLSNKGEKIGTSRPTAQSRGSTTRPTSSSAQPRQVLKQSKEKILVEERSSASRQLAQRSTSTTSESSSKQLGETTKQHPQPTNKITVNPATKENLTNIQEWSSSFGIRAKASVNTARPPINPEQSLQVVKKAPNPTCGIMAQANRSTAESAFAPPQHDEEVKENPQFGNICTDNSAAKENLVIVEEQNSASERMSESRIQSPRRMSDPAQPYQVLEQNQMLTDMFRHATTDEHVTNRGESSCSSGQTVPDSPSTRKREGATPDPETSCSPTKKVKSPSKKSNK